VIFAGVGRKAKQELGPRVVWCGDGRAAVKRRQRAVEPESAARRAERSALRLELIKRELIVFETKNAGCEFP